MGTFGEIRRKAFSSRLIKIIKRELLLIILIVAACLYFNEEMGRLNRKVNDGIEMLRLMIEKTKEVERKPTP